MTPEMAFECLLVTPDPAVFSTMEGILQDFSIATKVCPYPSNAANLLKEGSTDLIVIDLEAENSSEFLRQIGTRTWQKPTVLCVSAADSVVPGVHVVLQKPVTRESGLTSLKAAYSRMVRDYRKHTRFAVMKQVTAAEDDRRPLQVTVTNIGEGGVGVTSVDTLRIGGILSFRLRLPELTNEISVQARVLWTRPYGAAGCEFVHIPPFDLQLIHAWLDSRYRIKKPLIPV
jgi:CheY-like chemotaxis protein